MYICLYNLVCGGNAGATTNHAHADTLPQLLMQLELPPAHNSDFSVPKYIGTTISNITFSTIEHLLQYLPTSVPEYICTKISDFRVSQYRTPPAAHLPRYSKCPIGPLMSIVSPICRDSKCCDIFPPSGKRGFSFLKYTLITYKCGAR